MKGAQGAESAIAIRPTSRRKLHELRCTTHSLTCVAWVGCLVCLAGMVSVLSTHEIVPESDEESESKPLTGRLITANLHHNQLGSVLQGGVWHARVVGRQKVRQGD